MALVRPSRTLKPVPGCCVASIVPGRACAACAPFCQAFLEDQPAVTAGWRLRPALWIDVPEAIYWNQAPSSA